MWVQIKLTQKFSSTRNHSLRSFMNMRFLFIVLAGLLNPANATSASAAQFIDAEKVVYDDRFYKLIGADSQVQVLADELGWAEGPVWIDSLNALIFSDVAADKILRWDKTSGLSEFLFPSGHAPDSMGSAWRGSNGLAIDNNGALVLAQQSSRRLARMLAPVIKPAPEYEVLADQYNGNSLNSPNDLAVHRSDDIYFTDPPYGLDGFENSPAVELDFFGVFRLTTNNKLKVITRDLEKPNGIAFSSDYSTLYVSNSETDKAQIIAIELDAQGNPINSRLFFDGGHLIAEGPGSTDGMTVHPSDYLFVSIPNGLGVLSPTGKLLGKVVIRQVTNMALDDTATQLFITTPKRLLRLKINAMP